MRYFASRKAQLSRQIRFCVRLTVAISAAFENSLSLETDVTGTARTTLQTGDSGRKQPEYYILHARLCRIISDDWFSQILKAVFQKNDMSVYR